MREIEKIGKNIVHSAIKVHKALGPGLLESAYQKCLAYELEQLGHKVQCELILPIEYGPVQVDAGYRVDMLIDESVIVENKTVEALQPINEAQLMTYLSGAQHKGQSLLAFYFSLCYPFFQQLNHQP